MARHGKERRPLLKNGWRGKRKRKEAGEESLAWKQNFTDEEKANYKAASEAEVRRLCGQLTEGLDELRHSNKYKEYLKAMSRFPQYSYRNVMLIAQQNPRATLVNSFTGWNSLGRKVNKGEKGLRILAPLIYKGKSSVQSVDMVPGLSDANRPQILAGFKATSVFDISQTSGRPLPELASVLTGDGPDPAISRALERVAGVQVVRQPLPVGVNGRWEADKQRIVLSDSLSPAHALKTLVHEIAHLRLHPPGCDIRRPCREVQAESIAFVVCAHFGLDTSEYSIGYVDSWCSATDQELYKSLGTIQREAATIIHMTEKELGREMLIGRALQPGLDAEQRPGARNAGWSQER